MSHLTVIKTQMSDRLALLAALEAMKLTAIEGDLKLTNPRWQKGVTMDVHILVSKTELGGATDAGWRLKDGIYEPILDLYELRGWKYSHRSNGSEFVPQLHEQYATEIVKRNLPGVKITGRTILENGTVQLSLEREEVKAKATTRTLLAGR